MPDIIDLEFNIESCQSYTYVQSSVALITGDPYEQIYDIC